VFLFVLGVGFLPLFEKVKRGAKGRGESYELVEVSAKLKLKSLKSKPIKPKLKRYRINHIRNFVTKGIYCKKAINRKCSIITIKLRSITSQSLVYKELYCHSYFEGGRYSINLNKVLFHF